LEKEQRACEKYSVYGGYDAASFARIGVGVRALGMAGAFTAVAEGPMAAYWNPAGLATLPTFSAEGMYTNWMSAGIPYQYLILAGYPPLREGRPALLWQGEPVVFGLGLVSVVVPDIPWIEESGETGVFTALSNLFLLSFGLSLPNPSGLSLGASLKIYHDRILEGTSFGLGLDLGFLWRGEVAGIPVSLGIVTTDVGETKIRWYGTPRGAGEFCALACPGGFRRPALGGKNPHGRELRVGAPPAAVRAAAQGWGALLRVGLSAVRLRAAFGGAQGPLAGWARGSPPGVTGN